MYACFREKGAVSILVCLEIVLALTFWELDIVCLCVRSDPPPPLKIYRARITLCLFTFLISISSPSPAIQCAASIDTYLPNQLCVCTSSLCVCCKCVHLIQLTSR